VPGQTGGDLIKAVYVMKRCHANRPAALVSVIVDRVMGLGSLSLLAAGAVLFYLDDPEFRFLALAIWGVLLLVLLLGIMAFSRRIRSLIRLTALLQKLPGGFRNILERVDQAVFFYRGHKLAMSLWMLGGMGSHVINVLCVYFIGEALGMGVSLADYYVLVPVILIVSAVPIGPNGWGVGELMFGYLFPKYAASLATATVMFTRAVSLSLLYRIHLTLWSLLGGLILALTKDRVTRQDVEDQVALEEAEEMTGAGQISGDGGAPAG
jgi:glycosyltransferase 2 family protein